MRDPSSSNSVREIKRQLQADWDSGVRSRVVDRVSEAELRQLGDDALLELLAAEIEWRKLAGERVEVAEYVVSFPQLSEQIGRLFASADAPSRGIANSDTTTHVGAADKTPSPMLDFIGGFRVIRPIGSGGMGQVYEVEDPELGRRLALKRPHLEHDAKARERFLREARAAAALNHDNLVPIYQVGRDERGAPFLVMPLLDGCTLRDHFPPNGPLPEAEVVRIAKDTAAGLAAAHRAGLVHRDIKPANLWVERGSGRVKILDFGLARSLDAADGITQSGQTPGTPDHMSPEQVEGRPIDARTDLFSLGCVLYRAATGQSPFAGSTQLSVLRRVVEHHPPTPRKLNPAISAELSALILRLLEKEPADRFRDAEDFLRALPVHGDHSAEPRGTSSAATLRRPKITVPVGCFVTCVATLLLGYFITLLPQNSPGIASAPPLAPDPAPVVKTTPSAKPPIKPLESPLTYENKLKMRFRRIDPGEFMMGAPASDQDASADERPSHAVRITKPFYLGIHEVTQGQFENVLGKNPSYWTSQSLAADAVTNGNTAEVPKRANLPVESATMADVLEFCRRISDAKHKYRLPTEAEWEYACRAGTTTRYPNGDDTKGAYAVAHLGGAPRALHRPKHPLPVGSLEPNAWGLFDMSGNVREWCADRWGRYSAAPAVDPQGPTVGDTYAVRGGCYFYRAEDGRSSSRFNLEVPSPNRGFRVALELLEP